MVHRRFFFDGGVRAEIEGIDRERFLNIAAQRELTVCEVSEDPKTRTVTFWTRAADYKKMKPVAKKAQVRLRLKGKYGLPFFLYRNRARKLLAAGFAGFFLTLYGLSFFIWDISFEGNYRFTDETLLHYMETLPVTCGMRKSEISCERLEGEIRSAFPEITWVSAEIKGTRLTVRVKENEVLLAPVPIDETPCDLTAGKEGTIVRTVTRSGLCQVKAGDTVAAGDLLVSGMIPIYDDAETLVNSHAVHADAEVYAETVHTFTYRLPAVRTELSRTGRTRNGAFFEIFSQPFYFLMPASGDLPWEYVMEERQLKFFEDFYLPVYGAALTAYEYVPYEKAYTEEEVKEIADRKIQEYMEKLSEKGIQILGNDDKIERNESGWRILSTLTVVEDIAKAVPIAEQQEENQTVDEHY